MYNYILPQQAIAHADQKAKDYVTSLTEGYFAFVTSNIKSFDQVTGQTFTTYTKKMLESVKEAEENAKQFIKTGKVQCPFTATNKG
jgi:hypothetical protein